MMNDFRQNYRLGDMTAVAFAQAAASNPVILLPLGSHEDHGPHLPMGDYLLAEQLAVRIAQAANGKGINLRCALPAFRCRGLFWLFSGRSGAFRRQFSGGAE